MVRWNHAPDRVRWHEYCATQFGAVLYRRVGQLNALRVFRDTTDMAANPNLWGKVTDAMDRSRYLIVVLSPRAAASKWVNKEVAYWLEHRGPDQLLLVVAEGHMHYDGDTGRFDPQRSDVAGVTPAAGYEVVWLFDAESQGRSALAAILRESSATGVLEFWES